MVNGRVELLSCDFALGWAEINGQERLLAYATVDGIVIGVGQADIDRPDLEALRLEQGPNAKAFIIVFDRSLTESQFKEVQVGIVGKPDYLKRAAGLKLDRFPKLQLFLIGSPRSGTSELGSTIARTLGLPWLGECHAAHLFANAARSLSGDKRSDHGIVRFMGRQHFESSAIEACKRAYFFMHTSASFIDKTPGIPMIAATPFLLESFPSAKVIYLFRNGISNVLSRMVKFGGSFEGHCSDWRGACETWERTRGELPSYLELRQEDMLARPAAVANAVADYLGLPETAEALEKSLQSGSLERTGAGIGRDRFQHTGWTTSQIELFTRICGSTMERLGYSVE